MKGRGVDRKGHARTGPPFTQIFHYVSDSLAYRCLSPADRCVLFEIARRYNGANNGRIGLSVREAAELCNINKDTAGRAFHRLEEKGLIECGQEGAFSYKVRHAAEWRLTWHRCDRTGALPSRAFLKWSLTSETAKSDPRSERKGQRVRSRGTDADEQPSSVPSFRTDLRVVGQ